MSSQNYIIIKGEPFPSEMKQLSLVLEEMTWPVMTQLFLGNKFTPAFSEVEIVDHGTFRKQHVAVWVGGVGIVIWHSIFTDIYDKYKV